MGRERRGMTRRERRRFWRRFVVGLLVVVAVAGALLAWGQWRKANRQDYIDAFHPAVVRAMERADEVDRWDSSQRLPVRGKALVVDTTPFSTRGLYVDRPELNVNTIQPIHWLASDTDRLPEHYAFIVDSRLDLAPLLIGHAEATMFVLIPADVKSARYGFRGRVGARFRSYRVLVYYWPADEVAGAFEFRLDPSGAITDPGPGQRDVTIVDPAMRDRILTWIANLPREQ